MSNRVAALTDKSNQKEATIVVQLFRGHCTATYIHAGKIGVMVEVTCESNLIARSELFQALIHDIAMQIAASDPKLIRKVNVPLEIVRQEREKYRIQAAVTQNQPK